MRELSELRGGSCGGFESLNGFEGRSCLRDVKAGKPVKLIRFCKLAKSDFHNIRACLVSLTRNLPPPEFPFATNESPFRELTLACVEGIANGVGRLERV